VRLELGEEDFVTAVFLHVDQQGWLEVVNCGHPPPLRLGHDGQLRLLEPASFATPLSLSPRLYVDCYMLRPGDRVLVHTDGLLEARDTRGRSFLLRKHLDVLSRPSLDDAVERPAAAGGGTQRQAPARRPCAAADAGRRGRGRRGGHDRAARRGRG
jgi:phosphoserine phosphatase RsbU/P